jgi:uncharacterized protein
MELKEVIGIINRLKGEIATAYKADIQGVFGSFARGDQNPDSDIDLLVEFKEGATFLHLSGLGLFLEDRLGCKVDIVSTRALREELRPRVYKDLVRV